MADLPIGAYIASSGYRAQAGTGVDVLARRVAALAPYLVVHNYDDFPDDPTDAFSATCPANALDGRPDASFDFDLDPPRDDMYGEVDQWRLAVHLGGRCIMLALPTAELAAADVDRVIAGLQVFRALPPGPPEHSDHRSSGARGGPGPGPIERGPGRDGTV